jgi:putative ABC transport system permease protein
MTGTMDTLARDLRYSLRMLAKAPGFAALAIATLALGIGANTAIFTVANSVLLRSLPYKDPGQLVRISTHRDGSCCVSLPYFTVLSATNRSFSGVTAYQFDAVNLAVPDGAEQIDAERVTGNFFDVLGARLLAGRTFTPEEDQLGGNQVVVVGYELAANTSRSIPGTTQSSVLFRRSSACNCSAASPKSGCPGSSNSA